MMADIWVTMNFSQGKWRVDLPTYSMYPDTIDYEANRVMVKVPDDYVANEGISVGNVRRIYRGQPSVDEPGLGRRITTLQAMMGGPGIPDPRPSLTGNNP